ncbi:hypothetical protein [Bradyrhizobium sp. CCBAU 53421]|uniref:hypothetical protein n=1 Tax=Bradyrhizobium sp. CCBAU 53421 TaxID=1325120 RepID=UPI00188CD009|nr:hypothetical protein [Bradyrhizobium sp. CCBAU 53421]QOZ32104.1 hypothetical protein XH92_10715 [Bradyrhizobium sp. CCBAU 53421]
MSFRKDRSLDELARIGNVAQFVSFAPDTGKNAQQFSRVAGYDPNNRFANNRIALVELLASSSDRSINLRSFTPESPQSREFHYGLKSSEEASSLLERLLSEGMFVIANETVDVNDGGVSGVIQGDVIEFAPDDTPRCVEKEGAASLPTDLGLALLNSVYGFRPEVVDAGRGRLEFSIHPKPRGWRRTHTLMWEYEKSTRAPAQARLTWPNKFSRHIGDKAFGLMIADAMGLRVPRTTVISRRVKPFSFGQDTGSHEVWTRTCPREQEPGRFTTAKGWLDPFDLLAAEDPQGTSISSVLSQAAVHARFSGAAITDSEGKPILEGVAGEGDAFMLGKKSPERMPESVLEDVAETYLSAMRKLGPVRFEWVHDGSKVWIVQLHRGGTSSVAATLVPGEASRWEVFEVSKGLEELRRLLHSLPDDVGVRIRGEIGLTSHFADLLRKMNRPSRIASSDPASAN